MKNEQFISNRVAQDVYQNTFVVLNFIMKSGKFW